MRDCVYNIVSTRENFGLSEMYFLARATYHQEHGFPITLEIPPTSFPPPPPLPTKIRLAHSLNCPIYAHHYSESCAAACVCVCGLARLFVYRFHHLLITQTRCVTLLHTLSVSLSLSLSLSPHSGVCGCVCVCVGGPPVTQPTNLRLKISTLATFFGAARPASETQRVNFNFKKSTTLNILNCTS